MAMLEALPQHSFITKTPWFKDARKFTGPLLRDVLSPGGRTGHARCASSALNDYRIDMPVDDARRFDVLLARLIDDKPIAVRDKGPLFMIYPFDSDADAAQRRCTTAARYGNSRRSTCCRRADVAAVGLVRRQRRRC